MPTKKKPTTKRSNSARSVVASQAVHAPTCATEGAKPTALTAYERLTPLRQRFVDEYMKDLNAKQAAIRCGSTAAQPEQAGYEFLNYPDVAAAIDERRAALSHAAEIDTVRLLRELSRIAFGSARDVMTWGPDGVTLKAAEDLDDDEAAIVSEASQTVAQFGGSIKLKTHDKLRALELLGRYAGIFKDKVAIGGADDMPPIRQETTSAPLTPMEAYMRMLGKA